MPVEEVTSLHKDVTPLYWGWRRGDDFSKSRSPLCQSFAWFCFLVLCFSLYDLHISCDHLRHMSYVACKPINILCSIKYMFISTWIFVLVMCKTNKLNYFCYLINYIHNVYGEKKLWYQKLKFNFFSFYIRCPQYIYSIYKVLINLKFEPDECKQSDKFF